MSISKESVSENISNSNSDKGTDIEESLEIQSEITDESSKNFTGKHVVNHTGSMIIKRRELSMDNGLDLIAAMAQKYSSRNILPEQKSTTNEPDNANNKPNTNGVKEVDDNAPVPFIPLSATEEIRLNEKGKEKLEKEFKKFAEDGDQDGNGDSDIKEFKNGLKAVGVKLSDAELTELFNFIDKDHTGFVDHIDFCNFAYAPYENPVLCKYQKAILTGFGVYNSAHERRHSNLIKKAESQDWGTYDLVALESEMQDHMREMVNTMAVKVKQEEQFVAKMEKRHQANPALFKPEKAREWTEYEVVAWLETIGLSEYSKYFAIEKIDGPMLLEDIDDHQLIEHLGVKPIHAKKIMRGIHDLRKSIRLAHGEPYDLEENVVDIHQEDLDKIFQFDYYEKKIEELEKKNDELKDEYEKKIEELENENKNLNDEIKLLENKLLGEDEEDDDPIYTHIRSLSKTSDDGKDSNSNQLLKPTSILSMTKSASASSILSGPTGGPSVTSTVTNKKLIKFINALKLKAEEIEAQKEDGEDVEEFCGMKRENIIKWTNEEVAYWLIKIGFEQYSYVFFTTPIDGDMLTRDLTLDTLIDDLGVKKIHGKRILREVENLLKIVNSNVCMDFNIENLIFNIDPDQNRPKQEKINELIQKIKDLEEERNKIITELENKENGNEEESNYFSTKISDLEKENNDLKQKNDELQKNIDQLNENIQKLEKEKKKLQKYSDGNSYLEEEEEDDEDEELVTKEQIDERIKEQMDSNYDEDFCETSKALNWTVEEVCYWLKNIQFGVYITNFYNKHIDGSILLNDVDEEMLAKTLKVKSLHISKIEREIQNIKDKIGFKSQKINNNINIDDSNLYKQQIDQLNNELAETKQVLKEETNQRMGYELELQKMKEDFENEVKANNKVRIVELESIIEYERENKLRTIQEMNRELNTMRKAARIMQRDILWYKKELTRSPLDGLMGMLGYTKDTKY